ncbi:sepiapterin reductase-like [Episyrphus balteatus]|uniref:sepiapterin reductase-like n=1 Tax=Episyrphus balteatus TaxID=286459 RepID=UPI00248509A5|nr:sepiapterin reductase-like [Episyrphus balteatus]
MDLEKKTIFIISGASKGIGKTMAVECCRLFKPNSLAILFARSREGLEQTRKEIQAVNETITVKIYSMDLEEATCTDYHLIMADALTGFKVKDFERAFVIHNVGSVGDVSKTAKDLSDVDDWKKYFHLNVFGLCVLTAVFMTCFKDIEKLVVNITSGTAVKPYNTMAQYCSGKATREMFFKVLATEEKDTTVLNYSPGPVDTDFISNFQKESKNEELNKQFEKMKQEKTILTPELTTKKFLQVLKEFKFKSGDRVDYFDEIH